MAGNFLKSIVLLGIALLSALYSNGAAREGQIVSAGIGALIAMAIAIWVGVRFVPSLAAGVDWKWLPFFTQYRLTREGWIYIAATLIVLSAALNTSNNLLYMVLSALLAVMVLSGFLSGINFRQLEMSPRMPEHCIAKKPFQLSLTLHNRKDLFPTFSLNIGPADGSPIRFRSYYLPLLRIRGADTRLLEAVLPSRGRHSLGQIQLESRYPFGFVVKRRAVEAKGDCVVFPEILPAEDLGLSLRDLQGSSERFERGQGMDLYMIRDYVSSDSARHVDWKASAKTSALKIREFAAEESQRVLLLFDRYGQAGDEERFERLVSKAASFAFHLSGAGIAVTLASQDWSPPPGPADRLLEAILHYLALVEMTPRAQPVVRDDGGTITFTLRSSLHRQVPSIPDRLKAG